MGHSYDDTKKVKENFMNNGADHFEIKPMC